MRALTRLLCPRFSAPTAHDALFLGCRTLASKRNPIAWLTNTSHETLQVFHRWVAHFMLIMGLIHTFAFVKFNAQAGISQQRWSESYQCERNQSSRGAREMFLADCFADIKIGPV